MALEELAGDYLLSEDETSELGSIVQQTVNAKWLRRMYQAGSSTNSDVDRQAFAYGAFDQACLDIVRKRSKVVLPSPEEVEQEIDRFARTISPLDDSLGGAAPVPAS